MKTLIVEDDFSSRILLQTLVGRHGECHVAVNGLEAVKAVKTARVGGEPYDLICLDIMMPEMDGQTALKMIRTMEEADGIVSTSGARIVMTTALGDMKNVATAYRALCDGYLVKPVDRAKLDALLEELQLVQKLPLK